MSEESTVILKQKINLSEMGQRLGIIVASFDDGIKAAAQTGKISEITLNRYMKGEIQKLQLLPVARILNAKNISMEWLLYGDDYKKYRSWTSGQFNSGTN